MKDNYESTDSLIIRQMEFIGKLTKQKEKLLEALRRISITDFDRRADFKDWAQALALDTIESIEEARNDD